MPAGRAIIVPNLEQDYILSSDAVKFLPHPCLDKDYLVFAINSPAFRDQVIAEAHGVTRVRTSLRKLQTYLLPIPPIEEQKRIVSRLQDVFPLVKEYEEHEATRLSFDNEFNICTEELFSSNSITTSSETKSPCAEYGFFKSSAKTDVAQRQKIIKKR